MINNQSKSERPLFQQWGNRPRRPRYGSTGGPWSVAPAVIPEAVNVAEVRKAAGVALGRPHLTQDAFAKAYGLAPATVHDWEQGRKSPNRAARAFLTLIAADPVAAARHLAQGTGQP